MQEDSATLLFQVLMSEENLPDFLMQETQTYADAVSCVLDGRSDIIGAGVNTQSSSGAGVNTHSSSATVLHPYSIEDCGY